MPIQLKKFGLALKPGCPHTDRHSMRLTVKRIAKMLVVIGGTLAVVCFALKNHCFNDHPISARVPSKPHQPPVTVTVTHFTQENPKKPSPPLGKHKYRPNGLLEVNEHGPHPIYELMERAESDWKQKLEKSSRTLEEAVQEYRRRYHRAPPRGFDDWFVHFLSVYPMATKTPARRWNYVVENDVQLPDEYDQIYHDLEPFWGINPKDLIQTQAELEKTKDSYTLGKTAGSKIRIVTYAFDKGKYDQLIAGSRGLIKLLNEVSDYLPPFRATFSPHDSPNRLSDFAVKKAALNAASFKKYVKRGELPKISYLGWVSACSPASVAGRRPVNLDHPPGLQPKKTFIYDHPKSMDPCTHPQLFHQHGQFLSHNSGPTPQETMVPEFTQCSTTIHHNIRIPTSYGWVEDIFPRSEDPEWDDRIEERLMWRGTSTGTWRKVDTYWKHQQRDFLVWTTNEVNGTVRVLPPDRSKKERVGPLKEYRKARLNPALMDIAFVGDPVLCSPDSFCKEFQRTYAWRQRQNQAEAGKYKYVIDVDGNGWSGRFKRLMTTNAMVFKSTIYPEWYAGRVAPWVHYVPIQLDLSDLHDALLFFRGDANGEGAHEDLARKIAKAGREWSLTFWRREDIIAYFFRLLLEYARLMSLDRDAMSYDGLEGSQD
ncbi:glycosyl transferase family 90-domain-containing protein [Cyathus striatus]|nr:glycosyl transferase family 90-domain-containing protein [Cyathus striatus]